MASATGTLGEGSNAQKDDDGGSYPPQSNVRTNRSSGSRPRARTTAPASSQCPARRPRVQQAISNALDNEVCQCVLIIAVSLVPLALAIFVPRAVYRARAIDRERAAAAQE